MAFYALLADETPHWRSNRDGYELPGCRHLLEFPTVKLLDNGPQLDWRGTNKCPTPYPSSASLEPTASKKAHEKAKPPYCYVL